MSTCNTCKYYNSDDETCRRYPPVIRPKNPVAAVYLSEHPEVKWNDFCGEYKAKE